MATKQSIIDSMVGQVFGEWTVIGYAGKKRTHRFLCRCSCGTERAVCCYGLQYGTSKSCGHKHVSYKHGLHKGGTHPLYGVWKKMRSRCSQPSNKDYSDYGGRGIKVCERWDNADTGFQNFVADMEPKPSPAHTLDRINNTGGYGPENCGWRTRAEQARNRRNVHLVTYKGETHCVAEWCRRFGLNQAAIGYRINKLHLSGAEALFGRGSTE